MTVAVTVDVTVAVAVVVHMAIALDLATATAVAIVMVVAMAMDMAMAMAVVVLTSGVRPRTLAQALHGVRARVDGAGLGRWPKHCMHCSHRDGVRGAFGCCNV